MIEIGIIFPSTSFFKPWQYPWLGYSSLLLAIGARLGRECSVVMIVVYRGKRVVFSL